MATAVRPMKKRRENLSPLHPVVQSQIVREPKVPSPLQAFVRSVEDEIPIHEAIAEFQEHWCEHPDKEQEVLSTRYAPVADRHEYVLICNCCGRMKLRQGRAPRKYES